MRSIGVTRLTSVDHVIDTERFWALVRSAYCDVMGGTDAEGVERLKSEIVKRPPEEQVLFYHEEPLNVALDLLENEDASRVMEPDEDQMRRYLALARELGWPSY